LDTFHEQIGNWVAEDIVIDRGYHDIENTLDEFNHLSLEDIPTNHLRNKKYWVTKNGIECIVKHNKYHIQEWLNGELYERIYQFFLVNVFPHTNQSVIQIFTEYAIIGEEGIVVELYRGDLLYKNGGWNDWVYINWDNYGEIPGRILFFFELEDWEEGHMLECNNTYITGPGKYALCYMVENNLNSPIDDINHENFHAHPSSLLVKSAQLMLENNLVLNKMQPKFGIIEIDSFGGPCVAVPYDIKQDVEPYWYLFIEPKSTWKHILIKFLQKKNLLLDYPNIL
jgi:hypothetical protein